MVTWMLHRSATGGVWTLYKVGDYQRTVCTFPTLREAARWLAEHDVDGGQ